MARITLDTNEIENLLTIELSKEESNDVTAHIYFHPSANAPSSILYALDQNASELATAMVNQFKNEPRYQAARLGDVELDLSFTNASAGIELTVKGMPDEKIIADFRTALREAKKTIMPRSQTNEERTHG